MLKYRKNLKDKPEYHSVNINEDLTSIRNGIAYRARQLKQLKLVTDTWTVDRKMCVKVRDRVVLVNNVTALNKLASEIVVGMLLKLSMTSTLNHRSTTDRDTHRSPLESKNIRNRMHRPQHQTMLNHIIDCTLLKHNKLFDLQ
jgi:hypothetical protein